MTLPSTPVADFLRTFGSNSSTMNLTDSVPQFAPAFLAAGPNGAQPVNAADFARILPTRRQHFESLGLGAMSLTSVQETPLSPRYTLARTYWRVEFATPFPGEPELLVETIYIVDTAAEPFQIVLYLACQDLAAILQARLSACKQAPPA